MNRMEVKGVAVFFDDPADRDAAGEIGGHASDAARYLVNQWGLKPPRRYRVYVLTSPTRFVLHSAPWLLRPLVFLILPIMHHFAMRIWAKTGGLTSPWVARPAIGVKPRRLLQNLDRSVGQMIFLDESDLSIRVRGIAGHEMTHALTSHLRLPMWLSEGFAVLAAERFLGKPMVRPETLARLKPAGEGRPPSPRHRITDLDTETLAYQYIRGYWITRYMSEMHPDLLKSLLAKRRTNGQIDRMIANQLCLGRRRLWRDVDAVVAGHSAASGGAPPSGCRTQNGTS